MSDVGSLTNVVDAPARRHVATETPEEITTFGSSASTPANGLPTFTKLRSQSNALCCHLSYCVCAFA